MPICPQCPGRHFKNDAALRAHSKTLKHGLHVCGKCGNGFSSKQGLEQHTLDKHTTFECHYCDREFVTENGRLAHEQTKHPPTFGCEYCDREFATDEGRLVHQKVKHTTFACDLCDREFISEEALEQHTAAKHPGYECRYCGCEFATEDSRDAHEKYKHPIFECNFCDLEFTSEDNRRKHEDANHGAVECLYCDQLFSSDEALMQHANAKHPPQRRAVWRPRIGFMMRDELIEEDSTDDGQESATSPSRSAHSTVDEDVFHSPSQMLSTDTIGEETCIGPSDSCSCFLCSPCRQTSLLSDAEDVPDDAENTVSDCHDDSAGQREPSFQCTPCLMLFETEGALRDHVCPSRTAMVRPYCFLCFGQFEDQPSVQKHLESLLTCQFCPLRFCSAEALESHLVTHPTCGKCYKSFADSVSLSMHVASDHPVVVCWDCDGAVVELHHLELHYRDSPAHATCSICGLGQKNVADLSEHVKREHAAAEIAADTSHDDVPGACEGPSRGDDQGTVPLEQPDRTPTPFIAGSGLGPSEQGVGPTDAPPQPPALSEAEHGTDDADGIREYASPSPTPSEHGSNTSRLRSPAINGTIRNGTVASSPASSASSASFSESATSDENSIVLVSTDGIPEYVRENRAVLVATSAQGRPLRLPSESSLASLDMSAGERATASASTAATSGTYRLHCRICLRDPCENMTATICGHLFCKRCITQAVIGKSECPVCESATLLYCLFKLDLSA